MKKLLLSLAIAASITAQEWVLIAHPSSRFGSLHSEQIKEVYLGKKHYIGGVRITPLQLTADDPLRRQFEEEILEMSRPQLREWWTRRHYLGQRPPKVVGSAEAVLAYVQQVSGTVGYVPVGLAEDANVSILYDSEETRP